MDSYWDDRSPAGCPAPANRDRHHPGGDKSAWRCPWYADADGSGTEDQAVQEALERFPWALVHTTPRGLVRQARKRFGRAGALASGWLGWRDRLAMGSG